MRPLCFLVFLHFFAIANYNSSNNLLHTLHSDYKTSYSRSVNGNKNTINKLDNEPKFSPNVSQYMFKPKANLTYPLPEVMFDTIYSKPWPPLVSKIEQITLDKKKVIVQVKVLNRRTKPTSLELRRCTYWETTRVDWAGLGPYGLHIQFLTSWPRYICI